MPVYNGSQYIASSIQSILNQSFVDFELIIFDDGSSDESAMIADTFKDNRIRIIHNAENRGVVAARNELLHQARGQYYAFFDADDLAQPEKFRIQIEWLRNHPQFVMLGSSVRLIDSQGRKRGHWKLGKNPSKAKALMIFQNYFVNSAVVFRAEAVQNGKFPQGFEICEDYHFWWKLQQKGEIYNLPHFLCDYRLHSESLTGSQPDVLSACDRKLYKIILEDIGIQATEEEIHLHMMLKSGQAPGSPQSIRKFQRWIIKVCHTAAANGFINNSTAHWLAFNRWLKLSYSLRRKPALLIYCVFYIPFYIHLSKIAKKNAKD